MIFGSGGPVDQLFNMTNPYNSKQTIGEAIRDLMLNNRYDARRALQQPSLYNGGDITATLSAANAASQIASPVIIAGSDSAFRYSGGFIGLTVGPNDTVWKPDFSLWKKRVGYLGDSFTGGANATLSIDTYPYVIAEVLGWEPVMFGESSTGYTTQGTGGNGRDTFLDRVTSDVIPQTPDVVVIYGGTNDNLVSAPPALTLQQAATATYAALASGLSGVPVYVFGIQYPSGAADSARDAKDAVLASACATAQNVVRFTSVKSWFTGTGKVGATTGSGNSDLFTSNDGLHPSTDGHLYIGHRMAQAIAASM